MRIIAILLISVCVVGCSPQARLARLIKNNPQLVKSDTIKIHDTTFVKSIHIDTIIQAGVTPDTVTIVKDKLVIKYFNNGKTVYLGGEVKRDTIIKEIPVIVNTVTPAVPYVPDFYKFSTWALYILLIVEALLLWLYLKKSDR